MADTEVANCPWCGEVPDVSNNASFRLTDGVKYGALQCCVVGPEVRTDYKDVPHWRDRAIAAWNDRKALASRPAEVDDEGLPDLPVPHTKVIDHSMAGWREIYQELFTAEQYRQGQRDAVAADRERMPVSELLGEIQSAIDTLDQTELENRFYVPIVNTLHHCRDAFKGDGFYGGYRAAPSHTTNKENG